MHRTDDTVTDLENLTKQMCVLFSRSAAQHLGRQYGHYAAVMLLCMTCDLADA